MKLKFSKISVIICVFNKELQVKHLLFHPVCLFAWICFDAQLVKIFLSYFCDSCLLSYEYSLWTLAYLRWGKIAPPAAGDNYLLGKRWFREIFKVRYSAQWVFHKPFFFFFLYLWTDFDFLNCCIELILNMIYPNVLSPLDSLQTVSSCVE